MQAADPADRIRAIVAAVERPDSDRRSVAASLVDRLDDEDEAVRWFAIAGLERVAGRRFDYQASAPLDRRRLATERWRQYLASTAPAQAEAAP